MVQSDNHIAHLIKERITLADPSAKVILFGSRARGNEREDSDWDVLILISKPLQTKTEERKYRNQVFELELEIEQAISVIVVTEKDWNDKYYFSPLYQSIKEEGVIL